MTFVTPQSLDEADIQGLVSALVGMFMSGVKTGVVNALVREGKSPGKAAADAKQFGELLVEDTEFMGWLGLVALAKATGAPFPDAPPDVTIVS